MASYTKNWNYDGFSSEAFLTSESSESRVISALFPRVWDRQIVPKSLFALREILFVLQKMCQREMIFGANDFFDPPKFSQEPPNFKDAINYF